MPATINHAKSDTIADFTGTVTVYNSAGNSATVAATNLVRPTDWNSGHQYTLLVAPTEIQPSGVFFEPFQPIQSNTTVEAPAIGTWYFDPFVAPNGLGSGQIRNFNVRDSSIFLHGVIGTTSAATASVTAIFRNCLAIYSQGTGANDTRLESLWTGECAVSATKSIAYSSGSATSVCHVSNYLTLGMISNINSAAAFTTTGITASGTFSTAVSTMASTKPNSLVTAAQNWFTGSVMDIIPFASTLAPGNYWMAQMFTTGSGGSGSSGAGNYVAGTYFNGSNSRLVQMDVNLSAFKRLGFSSAADASSAGVPFRGTMATGSSNAFSTVATSDIRAYSRRIYWNFCQDTK